MRDDSFRFRVSSSENHPLAGDRGGRIIAELNRAYVVGKTRNFSWYVAYG